MQKPYDVDIDKEGNIILTMFGQVYDLFSNEASDLAILLACALQESDIIKKQLQEKSA